MTFLLEVTGVLKGSRRNLRIPPPDRSRSPEEFFKCSLSPPPHHQTLTQCPISAKAPEGTSPGFDGAFSKLTASCATALNSFSDASGSAICEEPFAGNDPPPGSCAPPSLGSAHSSCHVTARHVQGLQQFHRELSSWATRTRHQRRLPRRVQQQSDIACGQGIDRGSRSTMPGSGATGTTQQRADQRAAEARPREQAPQRPAGHRARARRGAAPNRCRSMPPPGRLGRLHLGTTARSRMERRLPPDVDSHRGRRR